MGMFLIDRECSRLWRPNFLMLIRCLEGSSSAMWKIVVPQEIKLINKYSEITQCLEQ